MTQHSPPSVRVVLMSNKPDNAGLDNAGAGTRAVWGGEQVRHPYNATQTPIVCGYHHIDVWYEVALGKTPGLICSRMSNPTVETLEAKNCELEMAEPAVAFSSSMAVISSVLFTIPGQWRSCGVDQGQLRWHQQDFRRIPAAHGR